MYFEVMVKITSKNDEVEVEFLLKLDGLIIVYNKIYCNYCSKQVCITVFTECKRNQPRDLTTTWVGMHIRILPMVNGIKKANLSIT